MRSATRAPRAWSDDDLAWLITLYPTEPLALVAFTLGRRHKTCTSAARNHGISKIVWDHKPFSAMEDAWIIALFPHIATEDVAFALGRATMSITARAKLLGIRKDNGYMRDMLARVAAKVQAAGAAHRFKKGMVPPNKGMKGWCAPGCEKTWFKKGHQRNDTAPIGADRVDSKDGYLLIKVSKEEQGAKASAWQPKHRVLWERANGKVPKGMVLQCVDGNKQNSDPANWRLISLAENMKRNTIHNYPRPIVEATLLRGAINRRINAHTRRTGG